MKTHSLVWILLNIYTMKLDITLSIVHELRAIQSVNLGLITGRNRDFSLILNTQNISRAHRASNLQRQFRCGKLLGREAEKSPPSNNKVKKALNYTSHLPNVFKPQCLFEHSENFIR
jgi:hypothetical protein